MMFLDCPAYLDTEGARRCGLPAEVRYRFIMRSSGGPLEAAMIRCPSGHWFNAPIESLTLESEKKRHPSNAAASSAFSRLDGRGETTVRHLPAEPRHEIGRPITAPPYYLGRPADIWITAMGPQPQAQAGSRRAEPNM